MIRLISLQQDVDLTIVTAALSRVFAFTTVTAGSVTVALYVFEFRFLALFATVAS